ncbi:hypothetical protein BCR34DRAFT_558700 [Clohesyomyces aquaticus]|uniref:SnoaL-like domain-containing protein n=1 Tax=Clohesyomyces aquaticus TaxID=1231657 RepID=A0A1Y1ZZD5_9PLEO|nr:hypothetical protein BCR34DRAFT_558700 [Clohesyomyces aquaticus]
MRVHPAMDWKYHFTINVFDCRAWDITAEEYLTEDFVLKNSDGTEVCGHEEAWAAFKGLYENFTAHTHESHGLIVVENG